MVFLNQFIRIINIISNFFGEILLAPVAILPGWFSLTLISAVLGILLLIVFKHTSDQKSIAVIRDNIKADLLAIRLFKDGNFLPLRIQADLFISSFKLLYYSIAPMAVMIIPVSLILVQLGTWYQARPFQIGDVFIVKVELKENFSTWPDLKLDSKPSAEIETGPVRIISRKEVYWNLKPLEKGYHDLIFFIGDEVIQKKLAVGDGFMRISSSRPGPVLKDIFLNPLEEPIGKDSIVRAISIEYPERSSRIYGTGWWLLYLFIISMVSTLIFKPLIKVRL
jgi:hypothetical protein